MHKSVSSSLVGFSVATAVSYSLASYLLFTPLYVLYRGGAAPVYTLMAIWFLSCVAAIVLSKGKKIWMLAPQLLVALVLLGTIYNNIMVCPGCVA